MYSLAKVQGFHIRAAFPSRSRSRTSRCRHAPIQRDHHHPARWPDQVSRPSRSPPLRQKVWVPNVSPYGPAMYIAVNGTDGASLSLPYQEHVVLGSNDTWISSPSPVPSNTTFTIPGPGNAGPNDLLPQLSVKLALGSSKIRADIVRLSPDPKNETLTHET
ncbi:hypothetical protein E4U52_004691 [Claviceps spartinae]|nr:hypothetical protein E4U52_004691 [Claviceps spartinae]